MNAHLSRAVGRALAAFAMAGALVTSQSAVARNSQPVEPDYTKGGKLEGDANHQNLGPIGVIANIWATGLVRGTDKTRMLQIRDVLAGSPAEGVLRKGDVILGVISPEVPPPPGLRDHRANDSRPSRSRAGGGGKAGHFGWNARKALSAAITEAETKEGDGKLVLNVWRSGRTMPVTIKLPVKGTYSDTAPWDCRTTQFLIRAACDAIEKRGLKGRGIPAHLEALGLLATGEPKYLPMVKQYVHGIANPGMKINVGPGGGASTWGLSYANLTVAEYHLATKDDYVLPALRERSRALAAGASDVGTWSHGTAYFFKAHGKLLKYPSAYGSMKQCGITALMSLVLAQKCGVKDEEVDKVVRRGLAFMRWYVDKGSIPYGDHDPWMKHHDGNGKNSQAAVLFDIAGDGEAAEYFSRMSLASYHEREVGHTGHFLGNIWGALGAARGGEEAAQFYNRKVRWYFELERRHDSSYVYQHQLASYDHRKYGRWSAAGPRLLMYCLPRRKLYITGRGGSSFSPFTGRDLDSAVVAAEFDADELQKEELLKALGHWSPLVRARAAKKLGGSVPVAMLGSPNRYARYGACLALGSQATDRLSELILKSDDVTLQYHAVRGVGSDRRAIPALLKRAALRQPERDPQRKLDLAVAGALRNGLFRNADMMKSADRSALIPAIKNLLVTPNGRARSLTSSCFKHLSEADLEQLWGDIYYAAKYQAPSGSMFAGGVRAAGLNLMVERRVQEGIAVGVDWALRQEGWGNGGRKDQGIPALLKYGGALKDFVDKINEVLAGWTKAARSKNNQEDAAAFKKRLSEALKKPAPDLVSIKSYIDATPDPLLVPQIDEVKGHVGSGQVSRKAPKSPEEEPAPRKVRVLPRRKRPTDAGLKKFDELLRARLEEAIKAGAKPKLHYSKHRSRVLITSIDGNGVLSFRGTRVPVTATVSFDALGLEEKKNLAMAVLEEGDPSDNAVAAFFLIATGNEADAKYHLQLAGEDAGVLSAFDARGND